MYSWSYPNALVLSIREYQVTQGLGLGPHVKLAL